MHPTYMHPTHGCTFIQHTCIQHTCIQHASNIHASNTWLHMHPTYMHPTYMHPTHGCTCIQHRCCESSGCCRKTGFLPCEPANVQTQASTCIPDDGRGRKGGKRRREKRRRNGPKKGQEMRDKCRCASLSHALLVTSVDTRGLHSRPAFQGKGSCRSSGGCRGSANVATAPP